MNAPWWEDELCRSKVGQFSEFDAYLYKELGRVFRMRPIQRGFGRQKSIPTRRDELVSVGFRQRSRVQMDGVRYRGGPEVVVKVVKSLKRARSVGQTLSYIGRHVPANDNSGDNERLRALRDEFGLELTVQAAKDRLQKWDLLSDEENQTAGIAETSTEETPSNSQNRRFRLNQAHHIVMSVPFGPKDIKTRETFSPALLVTLDYVFGHDGHRFFWAVHEDTGNCHAHVLVEAVSESGTRLRFDKWGDYLFGIRVTFAEHLRAVGIEAVANRREDRADLRASILLGEEPLRESWGIGDYYRLPADVPERVPRWWRKYGAEIVRRAKKKPREDKRRVVVPGGIEAIHVVGIRAPFPWIRKVPASSPKVQKYEQPLFDLLSETYKKPVDALNCLNDFLYEEIERTADGTYRCPHWAFGIWCLANYPRVFGDSMSGTPAPGWRQRIKSATKELKRGLHVISPTREQPTSKVLVNQANWEHERKRLIRSIARVIVWEEIQEYGTERSMEIADRLLADLAAFGKNMKGKLVKNFREVVAISALDDSQQRDESASAMTCTDGPNSPPLVITVKLDEVQKLPKKRRRRSDRGR